MWNVKGKSIDPARFGRLEPTEVLYEFEGPRILTIRDADGELNLAYWSDEDDQTWRYIVVPTTPAIVDALREGMTDVFYALNQPRCWVCDVSLQDEIVRCWRIDFDAIPCDALPAAETPLWASHVHGRGRQREATVGPARETSHANTESVSFEGRIRELDKDRLSFELREIEGTAGTQRFLFAADILEDVFQAFHEDARVTVAGRTSPLRSLLFAIALSKSKSA